MTPQNRFKKKRTGSSDNSLNRPPVEQPPLQQTALTRYQKEGEPDRWERDTPDVNEPVPVDWPLTPKSSWTNWNEQNTAGGGRVSSSVRRKYRSIKVGGK